MFHINTNSPILYWRMIWGHGIKLMGKTGILKNGQFQRSTTRRDLFYRFPPRNEKSHYLLSCHVALSTARQRERPNLPTIHTEPFG